VKGGAEQNGCRALILVVERDLHVRALEKYFLEEAGFDVDLVDDGRAALERARAIGPRILISEILVPKLDGLSVCRALKADPLTRSINVLIFSILAAEERAREAGADAFLRKPLNQDRLVDSVRELLRLHRCGRLATPRQSASTDDGKP
jgi:DNA-binding response OmpR family regulator